MREETSMLELLNERLEKEDIVKLVCDYDNKFNKLEENNNQLKSQLQQKDKEIERLQSIIKEVREYIELVETLAINDKRNIFSMSALKRILDKGE